MTKTKQNNHFGENLKCFRESLGETRTKFASDCGFSIYTIQNYELGRNSPNLERFLQICNAKRILPSRLLDGLIHSPTELTILHELEICMESLKLSQKQRVTGLLDILINCMLETEPKLSDANFGERIRILRINAGFEVDQLAEICMISVPTLQGYESGQYDPSIPVLLNLCQTFQVSPDYLLLPRLKWDPFPDNRMQNLLPHQIHSILQSTQYLLNNLLNE